MSNDHLDSQLVGNLAGVAFYRRRYQVHPDWPDRIRRVVMRSLEEIRRRAHAELRINDSITVYEFIDPVEYRNQAYPPEFRRNWSYKSIGLKGIMPW